MIRTTRLSFLGVFLLAMCVFFPIVGWPAGLFWLALIPLAVLVWIVRTQTTVSPAGLDLRSVFSSRHIDWAQVKGLSIPKRGFVRAHLDDDSEVPLPAVSYDRLRDLVDASGGRIPDPFAVPDPAQAESDADADAAATDAGASDDSAPGTEAGPAAADPARAEPQTVEPSGTASAADDAPTGDEAAGNAASSNATSEHPTPGDTDADRSAPAETTSDAAAAGDTPADRPSTAGSDTPRGASPTAGAADTAPGPASERE
ncbi:PH domain-containing protein [Nocardia sp. NPDC004568]|uniref:PH domain-containing protein n=1 Tax=Nocardia sp. NPDC004568 TaxID=3154551 RepID=UPI0033A508EA